MRRVLFAALLAAACTAAPARLHTTPARPHSVPAATCPKVVLAPTADPGLHPTGALLCEVGGSLPPVFHGTTIGATFAGNLARLITSSGRATDSAACTTNPAVDVIVFQYRGRTDDVVVRENCHPALAVLRTGMRTLDSDLAGIVGILSANRSRPGPEVVGLPVAEARQVAGDAGFRFSITATIDDADTPEGTVLLQDVGGDEIDVVVTTHRDPACSAAQLAWQYLPGGASTGNDLGTLAVRDTSGRPCTLRGPVTITGTDTAGRAVTVRRVAGGGVRLSPHAPPAQPTADATVRAGAILLVAEYRDDLTGGGGLCTPHRVVPATWRVAVGGSTALVPNANGAADAGPPGAHGLVTCRGEFTATRLGLRR